MPRQVSMPQCLNRLLAGRHQEFFLLMILLSVLNGIVIEFFNEVIFLSFVIFDVVYIF